MSAKPTTGTNRPSELPLRRWTVPVGGADPVPPDARRRQHLRGHQRRRRPLAHRPRRAADPDPVAVPRRLAASRRAHLQGGHDRAAPSSCGRCSSAPTTPSKGSPPASSSDTPTASPSRNRTPSPTRSTTSSRQPPRRRHLRDPDGGRRGLADRRHRRGHRSPPGRGRNSHRRPRCRLGRVLDAHGTRRHRTARPRHGRRSPRTSAGRHTSSFVPYSGLEHTARLARETRFRFVHRLQTSGDAELVALDIGQGRPVEAVLFVIGEAFGAEALQPGDLGLPVVGLEIHVHPVLRHLAIRAPG